MSISTMLKVGIAAPALALALSLGAQADAPDSALFKGLEARNIGPAGTSGRIAAVDAVSSNPNTIVAGAATGGVWISHNGGLNWTPVFDKEEVASIGAVAINQAHPDIIWVGTGEGNTRNSTSIGGGIYKSSDGGKSWSKLGLAGTERINRIALHPTDPDIAYVAALGSLWGDGSDDRGVYKTTNGGKTWSKVLAGPNRFTGATDIKMDPSNPDKLFAALWEFRRWPYTFKSGGPGSGLYVSYNGGETWTRLSEEDGLPKGTLGRAVFAVAPSDPSRVYALVEAQDSALIRSDDGGKNWQTVNSDTNIAVRPFYYTELAVDPQDPDTVYNVESRVQRSLDGGKTFSYIEAIDCCAFGNTIHIDTHTWWINPADPDHMIDGNDGGLAITRDGGDTWRFVENLPLAQFYHIAVDDQVPYNVYGGLQDNGSWRGPSEVWEVGGIRNLHWREIGFGDGFDAIPDPEAKNAGYGMSQGGNLFYWNLDTGEQRSIRPTPPRPDVELRFNWDSGFALDPFDPDTIYYGSQFLHKSTDKGLSWTTISEDLTTDNPEWQTYKQSGGLTPDVTAAENYTTITVVAPSPIEEGTIWVGTDDGRLHVTRDGGQSWTSLEDRVRGVPDNSWIPMIDPSPHDPGVAHVVFDNHRRGDMEPYVYRAENYGRRFEKISDDSLSGYALSVRQDPVDPNLLFAGTEFGLWVSLNGGEDWSKFTGGVPTVSVMDMAIQQRESDLVLGTHGRAVFVIDDISALRNLSEDDFNSRFRLLATTPGQQYDANTSPGGRFWGSGEFVGPNEPYGVMLTFMAAGDDLTHPDPEIERARKAAQRAKADGADDAAAKAGKATITVTDASGTVIRTFKANVHQGINRVVWDMRRDGLKPLPGGRELEDGVLPPGLEVPPGPYRVTMTFDGVEQTADVEVLKDPRSPFTIAAMQANHEAALALQDLDAKINAALTRIITARRDIDTVMALIADARTARDEVPEEDPMAALEEKAKAAKETLDEMETLFRTPPDTKGIVARDENVSFSVGRAQGFVTSTADAPSPAAQTYIAIAENEVSEAVSTLNDYLSGQFADLKTAVANSGLSLLSQGPVD